MLNFSIVLKEGDSFRIEQTNFKDIEIICGEDFLETTKHVTIDGQNAFIKVKLLPNLS